MKDVLIFFSFRKHKTDYYNQLIGPLRDASEKYDLRLHQGSLKDLHIEVIENQLVITESLTGRSLDSFDAVYFELWLNAPQQALAAALYLRDKNVPFISKETLNTVASTKIGEMARMAGGDVPLPRTFMSSSREILKVFKSNPPISYPFITKAADTFGGQMNYLVKNYSELKQAITAHPEQYFVIQEFIPNTHDYRVLVMGGKIRLVMRRARDADSTSHVNNTSAGGDAEFLLIDALTSEMQRDVLAAADKTLRSDFSGVDLIINSETGDHYVLEVNEAPAIQMGANPEIKIPKMMEFLTELANKSEKA